MCGEDVSFCLDAKEEDMRSGAILVFVLVMKNSRNVDRKVADGMLHVQDADRWVNENVGRPNEES